MLAASVQYWLWMAVVLTVNATLVYIAWWALFSDKSRGRRRCPKCWYDLAYSPGMQCPECGFKAKREKQFGRTRRRFWTALAAILAATVICVVASERATGRGFASYLPTRVLLWLVPYSSANGPEYRELLRRVGSRSFADAHLTALMKHCAAGDGHAKPTSDPWIQKYGMVIERWRHRLVENPAVENLLSELPPRVELTTQPRWPVGVSPRLQAQVREWWPHGMDCRVHVTPWVVLENGQRVAAGEQRTFVRPARDVASQIPLTFEIPVIDPATTSIEIEFQFERRRNPEVVNRAIARRNKLQFQDEDLPPTFEELPPWSPAGTYVFSVNTRVEQPADAPLAPAASPELEAALRDVFQRGAVKWEGGPSPVRISIDAAQTADPQFADTAIGVVVELLRDGVAARRLNIWWLAGLAGSADINYGFEIALEDLELLADANGEDGRWTMRVKGDVDMALRAGGGKSFWSGEFTVPLQVQVREGLAPSRTGWIEEQ